MQHLFNQGEGIVNISNLEFYLTFRPKEVSFAEESVSPPSIKVKSILYFIIFNRNFFSKKQEKSN